MAWTSPRTWVSGEKPTAAIFNLHIRDNLLWMFFRIQVGTVSITPSAPNTPTNQTVTFPIAFSATPYVVVSLASGVPGTTVTGWAGDTETTTDFRATVTRTNTTVTVLRWIAILP